MKNERGKIVLSHRFIHIYFFIWNFRGSIQIDEIPTENYCTLVKVYDYLFQAILPQRIYNPITAMGFSAMFTS